MLQGFTGGFVSTSAQSASVALAQTSTLGVAAVLTHPASVPFVQTSTVGVVTSATPSVVLAQTSTLAVTATVPISTVLPRGVETRLRAYLPNGADQGPLPGPDSANASYVLSDVGALTFGYAPQAPRSNLLGQPLEVALEVSSDGGVTWFEPPNSRFVYVADGRNPLDPSDRYQVDCKSYVWRLSKAVVLPNGLLNTDGKRAFLSANVGVVLKTLLNEAQARGALTGVSHSSFSTTTDSAGAAWNQTLTIYYEPGIDYLTVLLNLAEQGFCDFRTNGRSLQVFNPDTGAGGALAVDRTLPGGPQVTLRAGRDLTEAPFRRTWEGLADTAFFAGGEGATYTFTNPGAATPWGRQETFISNGSVTDAGTMASLTQAQLAQSDVERVEHTRGLDFTRASQLPFSHYGVGDYVWSAVNGTPPERLRVRQVTLTGNDRSLVSGNVVLNDRFLEADVRQQRRINGITNGASSGTGTGGPIPGTDTKAPAKVLGVAGSSTAFLGPGGFPQAQVSLSWTPVSTNADGTPASDIDHYEVFRRLFGSVVGSEKHFRDTTDASLDDSPYQTGSNWWFSVRAVDTTGNRGVRSDEVAVGMASDATPPQAPSAPVATAKLGTLSIAWDGLFATGTRPLDFDHVDVHVSTTNNFTPIYTPTSTQFDTLYDRGVSVVTNAAYGIPLYVKLIAVDRAGNKSTASAQATGTPTRLVGTDISANAITYEQIAFKDQDNVVLDGSFETAEYRADVSANTDTNAAWTFTQADRFHNAWSATVTAGGTSRDMYLLKINRDDRQIKAGEKLFVRFAHKSTVGANGTLQLFVRWVTGPTVVVSVTNVPATIFDNTWRQVATQVTAPANAASFTVGVNLSASATVGSHWVDAVEVRRTVGTAIIEDAAIGNAQIANLAVNDAKIATLDVGKLTAGSLNADVLLASTIRTATSGNRVEVSSTGIRMFRGSSLTGHWNPTYGQLRIYATTDASHTSTGHGLQFGDDDGQNLIIDNNEVMSRFNSNFGDLLLNREGGAVLLGGKVGGFNPDYSDAGVLPATDNHHIQLRASVEVHNKRDGDYNDLFAPFMVGPRGLEHLWMDTNEIGVADGAGGVNTFRLNPPHQDGSHHTVPVYIGSDGIAIRRIGASQAGVFCIDGDVSLQFIGGQVNARDNGPTGNRSMGATAFNLLTSSVTSKHMISDIDSPLDVVQRVKSRRWQYRDEVNPEDRWHYGPMLEDLPEEMHVDNGDGQIGYSLGSLLGLLWAAVRELAEKVDG